MGLILHTHTHTPHIIKEKGAITWRVESGMKVYALIKKHCVLSRLKIV